MTVTHPGKCNCDEHQAFEHEPYQRGDLMYCGECNKPLPGEYELHEPIEIRVNDSLGNHKTALFTANNNSTISYHIAASRGGVAECLSNLGARKPFPKKIVPGWQNETLDAVRSGYYTVTEVR